MPRPARAPRPTRRPTFALALTCALLAVAGCGNDGDSVFIVGDSITSLGDRQLRETLSGYQLNIAATFGATIDEQMNAARLGAESDPDQVVINLGTNDVLDGRKGAEAAASLEQMIGLFADVPCVHVVTVNANLDQKGDRPAAETQAFDQAIEEMTDRFDNLDLVPWHEMQAEAAAAGNPTALTSDGVHPDDEGQRQLAAAIGDALDGCGPL